MQNIGKNFNILVGGVASAAMMSASMTSGAFAAGEFQKLSDSANNGSSTVETIMKGITQPGVTVSGGKAFLTEKGRIVSDTIKTCSTSDQAVAIQVQSEVKGGITKYLFNPVAVNSVPSNSVDINLTHGRQVSAVVNDINNTFEKSGNSLGTNWYNVISQETDIVVWNGLQQPDCSNSTSSSNDGGSTSVGSGGCVEAVCGQPQQPQQQQHQEAGQSNGGNSTPGPRP
jgi:hypothetical protein